MPRHYAREANYFLLKNRLLLLLICILALLVGLPLLNEELVMYTVVSDFLLSLIMIAGIYAVSPNRQLLTVAILLATLTIVIIWSNILIPSRELIIMGLSLQIIFFILTITILLSHVLQYKRITADKIYGAICGYLMIGLMWSFGYTMIENISPGSFAFDHRLISTLYYGLQQPNYFPQFIYYSFITLTTTGYGDITPLSNIARAISPLEAVVGKLYVAILIARLVGLHITHTALKINNHKS